jgi:thiopeptide-type bacteriocin biosynthesis protein
MNVTRCFIPGSEWLYLKLYTGINSSDNFLILEINTLIKKLLKMRLIEKWFFVRYSDPNPHLRIRLLLAKKSDFGKVIEMFYAKLDKFTNSFIWKIQLDTYVRELERYNKLLIEESESIFFYSSKCIIKILHNLSQTNNSDAYRWMIALRIIDIFLAGFNLDNGEKLNLMRNMSNSFKIEFGYSNNNVIFKNKYRSNRKIINSVLKNENDDLIYRGLIFNIERESLMLKNIIMEVRGKINGMQEHFSLQKFLSDHIHMFMNRLFSSDNRYFELIIYDFLYKFYLETSVREK